MATSYANPGGQGDRTSIIDISLVGNLQGGTAENLIDGAIASNFSDAIAILNGQAGCSILFDFGEGVFKIIDEVTIWQSSNTTLGTWAVEASNDLIFFKRFATFTFGSGAATGQAIPFTNAGGYRYYQLKQLSGATSQNPYIQEIEFKIDAGSEAAADTTPQYSNKYGDGARTAIITASTSLSIVDPISASVDGGDISGYRYYFASGQTSGYIEWDFSEPVLITEFTFYQSNTVAEGTWQFQGSDNGSDWDDIGATFSLGGATTNVVTTPSANETYYRYYRVVMTAGSTSSSPYQLETTFKVAPVGPTPPEPTPSGASGRRVVIVHTN